MFLLPLRQILLQGLELFDFVVIEGLKLFVALDPLLVVRHRGSISSLVELIGVIFDILFKLINLRNTTLHI